MKTCINCGVELEEGLNECPLCTGYPASGSVEASNGPKNATEVIESGKLVRRQHLWELSGIITLSALIVCTIVDLVIVKGLHWSLFVDISVISLWLILTFLLWLGEKIIVMITGIMATTGVMLALFNILTGHPGWFYAIALPVVITIFVLSVVLALLSKKVNIKGFSLLASVFLAIALFLITLEVFIDSYKYGSFEIIWSAIAAASIVPITLLLFFVHYRMKKGNSLDSFFHI